MLRVNMQHARAFCLTPFGLDPDNHTYLRWDLVNIMQHLCTT